LRLQCNQKYIIVIIIIISSSIVIKITIIIIIIIKSSSSSTNTKTTELGVFCRPLKHNKLSSNTIFIYQILLAIYFVKYIAIIGLITKIKGK
jgi:hypothetical protein